MPTTAALMRRDMPSDSSEANILKSLMTPVNESTKYNTDKSSVESSSLPSQYRVPEHLIDDKPILVAGVGRFDLKQRFEGYVIECNDDEFIAIIRDKTNLAMDDEQVHIGVEEVSPGDRHLISPGAVFYWSIGYANYPGVPYSRQSRITFRRLAGWTAQELEHAHLKGSDLAQFFADD